MSMRQTYLKKRKINAFLEGMARVLDIFGTFNNLKTHPIIRRDDNEAIRKDWETVGKDLWNAMSEYRPRSN